MATLATKPVSGAAVQRWLASRGWKSFTFQREVWAAMKQGRSGLLHANTGTGKTLAAWLGALQALRVPAPSPGRGRTKVVAPPLSVLWLTPMRALAADTTRALREPLAELAPTWTIGLRSGDTTSAERSAQDRRLPTVLVTTPESLTLQLARADARDMLAHIQLVVVDEWHELLGNKRGVQVQLALARLRQRRPELMTWALSATLGNLDEALATLVGVRPHSRERDAPAPPPAVVRGDIAKTIVIDTLLPERAERFSWGGHMGLRMLAQVVQAIEESGTTLVFTNTRSQAERWYQALLDARPDWAGVIALHHGSLAREVREWVEAGLKSGALRAVVCTSSLDLGVDFLPVDRVLQIGSAKGIARLLQRAGRSGHAPGRPSRVTLVPTHSLELVEAAAARHAAQAGQVEARHSPAEPLDVLVQHLVTIALGGGFEPNALLAEVRTTTAYRELSQANWQWCLDFVRQGGPTLAAYPDFQRVAPDEQGVWRVPDARLARRHRVNIGTIVSDASINVQYVTGAPLGSVEESFVARMKPGDCFLFGGRLLELVRIHQMTAYVKKAPAGRGAVPRWNGGRMPLSNTLADAVLRELDAADHGLFDSPEMRCVQPLLEIQRAWSALPTPGTLVAETWKSREGWHLFLYPFAGRQVHLGLASLLAWRAAQPDQATFSIAINDYGLELLSARAIAWAERLPALLAVPQETGTLLAEVLASLNATELSRRRFREIARIAGLIFQSHPGERQSNRQLQASAGLYFDVFQRYDPGNRLLAQAESELLSQELDVAQLAAALARMGGQRLAVVALARPSPLAFPLMVERFREKLSNESLSERIGRMVADLEGRAGGAAVGTAGDDATLAFARTSVQASAQDAIALDREAARPPARTRTRRRP
jgi:ATP-dependent Lhr-like helicase